MTPPDYSYDSTPAQVESYSDYRAQDWLGIGFGLFLVAFSISAVIGPAVIRAYVGGDWRCAFISCSLRVPP